MAAIKTFEFECNVKCDVNHISPQAPKIVSVYSLRPCVQVNKGTLPQGSSLVMSLVKCQYMPLVLPQYLTSPLMNIKSHD